MDSFIFSNTDGSAQVAMRGYPQKLPGESERRTLAKSVPQRQFTKDMGFRGIGQADALPRLHLWASSSAAVAGTPKGSFSARLMRPAETSKTIIDPQAPRAKSNNEPVADFGMAELFLRGLATGTLGK